MPVTPSGNIATETIAVTVSGNIAPATIAVTVLLSGVELPGISLALLVFCTLLE